MSLGPLKALLTPGIILLLLPVANHHDTTLASNFQGLDRQEQQACHLWTREQWTEFLSSKLTSSKINSMYPDLVECRVLNQIFKDCSGELERLGLESCTRNARNWTLGCLDMGRHYGFSVDPATYLASQPQEAMALPKEFASGLPQNWTEIAKQNGWPYSIFDGVFQNGRTVILVPGDSYDRWLLMPQSNRPGIPDIITIQKKSIPEGRLLPKPIIHFREFSQFKPGMETILTPSLQGGRCVRCHSSGMVAIAPRNGLKAVDYVDGEDRDRISRQALPKSRVAALNRKMMEYGLPDWNRAYIPERFGPPVGNPAMNCRLCHDGITRGVLNASNFLPELNPTLSYKVLELKNMPPNPSFPENERTKRWDDLRSDYASELKYWLFRKESCSTY